MKRFLLHIALFIMSCFLLYLPLVTVAGVAGITSGVKFIPANYGLMGMRLEEGAEMALHGGPDVLLLGSSHCYRSFDTRLIDSTGIR
ncbi:MAG: hypothetical protein IJK99_10540, partial [Bacteroidales bacterium]|nr:hypothetical protein [Bacteroidales bacterium]